MTSVLNQIGHRPYPLPDQPWVLSMRWHDLLFLHWNVSPDHLKPHIPDELEVETFEGSAYLGLIPFRMSHIHARYLPPFPRVHSFPEINLRTYVSDGSHSGVWFFSLDAGSTLAVRTARWAFALPYFQAHMRIEEGEKQKIHYRSERDEREEGHLLYEGTYRRTDRIREREKTDLQSFLVDRYCLFSAGKSGRIYRGDIHHPPWSLYRAESTIRRLEIEGHPSIPDTSPDSILFAPDLSVRAWWPVSVGS